MSEVSERAFAALQRLVPQHQLSRLIGALAGSERAWISRPFVRGFCAAYPVDLSEAARTSQLDYRSFNDFFTRELTSDARPLAAEPSAICPADGMISQAGLISRGKLLQAKGHSYSLDALLGSHEHSAGFEGGTFATVYLAPHNYHRVHVPLSASLIRSTAIPGALYSVNATTESRIDGLFAKNERLVCHFDTEMGQMAVILVGAMIVASIEVVWGGPSTPYADIESRAHDLTFNRGAEMGRFLLGSTVIVCMQRNRTRLSANIESGASVRMGQALFDLM